MLHNAGRLETDPRLKYCPFCGSEAAFRLRDKAGHDKHTIMVECTNSSCGVMTPEHYATREKAIEAWNWRVSDLPLNQPFDASIELSTYRPGESNVEDFSNLQVSHKPPE